MESIPNDLMNGCTKVAFQWRPMKQNRKDALTGLHPRIGWLLLLHYHWHHPPVKRSFIGADAPLPLCNACLLHYNIPGGLVKTARLCLRSCKIDAQSVLHSFHLIKRIATVHSQSSRARAAPSPDRFVSLDPCNPAPSVLPASPVCYTTFADE